ncbi:lipopolysaccharide biosynthesis protein, partial [Micromonospora sp. DH15]|nr:lipopolysaccharide biosynthesis protein [Micromonospora sp. DH15]
RPSAGGRDAHPPTGPQASARPTPPPAVQGPPPVPPARPTTQPKPPGKSTVYRSSRDSDGVDPGRYSMALDPVEDRE